MSVLGEEFSRAAFEALHDPNELCARLEAELTQSLMDSSTPHAAIELFVEGLRSLGHDLHLWDSDGDGMEVYSEVWARHTSPNILSVVFHYGEAGRRAALVSFVRRADEARLRYCPACNVPMEGTLASFQVRGHGSATQSGMKVHLRFGNQIDESAYVGARSYHVEIAGFACPECEGCWFPSTSHKT